jgi:hypothetical protein
MFRGVANANLGNLQEARAWLEYARKHSEGKEDYDTVYQDAVNVLAKLNGLH